MGLIENLSPDLEAGRTNSRDLVEGCLEWILDASPGALTGIEIAQRSKKFATIGLRKVSRFNLPYSASLATSEIFGAIIGTVGKVMTSKSCV